MNDDLRSLGEFGMIDRIRDMFPCDDVCKGIGDDCAIMPGPDGKHTLVSSDMLIEGTHFLLGDISARQLGWKSLAVNLSDIAAMGGTPRASFLSIALPSNLPSSWVKEFLEGYREISSRYSTLLLGGDTCASPDRLCISVTVTGECEAGKAVLRSGAKVGDLICVSGPLGESAAGLRVILDGRSRSAYDEYLVGRHYLPTPRIEEGKILASCPGVHSMMDISDGLASDIRHIMKESGVGAEIEVDRVPLGSGKFGPDCHPSIEDALEGGEDYELLFTVDPKAEASLGVPHFVIGRIVRGGELVWIGSDRIFQGFRHF